MHVYNPEILNEFARVVSFKPGHNLLTANEGRTRLLTRTHAFSICSIIYITRNTTARAGCPLNHRFGSHHQDKHSSGWEFCGVGGCQKAP